MEPVSHTIYEFGPFQLDSARHALLRDSQALTITPKAFEILVLLLENRGALLTKTELQNRVWPETFVDENNLTQQISFLRKLLGESRENPLYIETVPRVGYRFIAETRAIRNGGNGNGAARPGTPLLQDIQDASHEAPEISSAQDASRGPLSRWSVLATTGIAVMAALAVTGFALLPVSPPALVDSTQLTYDGYAKVGTLLTDDQFVYFLEVRNGVKTIVRVPQAGGEPVALPAPPVSMIPLDYSSSRREILAMEDGALDAEHPIWTFALPAGPYRRLGNVTATAAAWSADGSEIFYAGSHKLRVMNSDATARQELTAIPGRVAGLRASPDGRLLRFIVRREQSTGPELWEARTDGSLAHRLSLDATIDGSLETGSWSADSRYFFFNESNSEKYNFWAIRKARFPFGKAALSQLSNGLMNAWDLVPSAIANRFFALGNIERVELLRYDGKSTILSPYLSGVSADGLTFTRQADRIAYTTFPGRALVTSNVDGSQRRILTNGSEVALLPAWSPDGKRIAFMRRVASGVWKIHIVSSDGGVAEELLPGSEDEANPTWSPDGNSLIYAGVPWTKGFAPGSTALHRVDLRTRSVETLPGTEGLWAPRWSPDGKYLIAEKYDSRYLVVYDFAAKNWRQIANSGGAANIGYTSWSRDSRYAYYNTYSQEHGAFYRVDISRGVTERISIPGEIGNAVTLGQWFTVTPNDSILMLRDNSIHELFALNLRLP